MNRNDVFEGLTWRKPPRVDVGGSLDGLYAAQGESVQTPAYVPPAPPVESEPPAEAPVTLAPHINSRAA
jgi:hypothetical protein